MHLLFIARHLPSFDMDTVQYLRNLEETLPQRRDIACPARRLDPLHVFFPVSPVCILEDQMIFFLIDDASIELRQALYWGPAIQRAKISLNLNIELPLAVRPTITLEYIHMGVMDLVHSQLTRPEVMRTF